MRASIRLQDTLWLALFVSLFGLELMFSSIDLLAYGLSELSGTEDAYITYDIFFGDGPTAELTWDVGMLSGAYLLALLLRRLGVLSEAFPLGRMNIQIVGLVLLAVFIDFQVSDVVYEFMATTSESGGVEIYNDAYAYEWTPDYLPTDIFGACISAPLFEEFVFRGFLMGVLLARGWHPALAVGVSAALFAYSHPQYNISGLILIFLSGCMFGVLRLLSGGLLAPILAHALLNAIIVSYDIIDYYSVSES